MPVELDDIALFAAVVREQGFTAAARALSLPPSVVSRRIARLEEAIGKPLLHRTTRSMGLTEAGRIFFERTSGLPQLVAETITAIHEGGENLTGSLKVTAPPDDGGIIWALVSPFLESHPGVDLEIHHTLERLDLVEHGVDLALRGGAPPDSALLTAQLLFDSRVLLAASPAYLAARGLPASAEDLEQHDGICMDAWAPNAVRRLTGDRGIVRLKMHNRVRSNSLGTAKQAALAGLGVAPLLELTCREELARGQLVEILRGALPDSAPMWAITPLPSARSRLLDALLASVLASARRIAKGGARGSSQS